MTNTDDFNALCTDILLALTDLAAGSQDEELRDDLAMLLDDTLLDDTLRTNICTARDSIILAQD